MRTALVLTLALSGAAVTGLAGQRSRRPAPDRGRADQSTSRDDYHFTPDLRSGQRLSVSNIDGEVVVTQSSGTSADIVVHKIVHRGDGSRVKAVLEETDGGYRVCTVFLRSGDNRDDRDSCSRGYNNGNDDNEPLDVEMRYDIRLPAGVELAVNTVDGDVRATGMDTPVTIHTVDGAVTLDGVAPQSLNTVDGKITATITNARWDHDLAIRSVDGAVDLTLPASIGLAISGETVDGEVHSDFPLTLEGRWGPRSFHATIGGGGSHELHLNTVDGSINLHQGGRRQGDGRDH